MPPCFNGSPFACVRLIQGKPWVFHREYAGKGKLESAFKTGGRPSFCPVQRQVCPLHGDDQNGDQNDLGDDARKGIGHCAGKEKGEIEHRVRKYERKS